MFQNIVSYSRFNFWKWNYMDILSVLSWISKTVSLSLEVWEIFYIDRYTGGHNERISKFTSSSSSTRLIEFRSTQGGFRRINTTRFKPASRNSKRTLGYQDLTNTDRNKLKKASLQAFYKRFTGRIYQKRQKTTSLCVIQDPPQLIEPKFNVYLVETHVS